MATTGNDELFCEIGIDLGFFEKSDANKALDSQRVDEAIGESKPIGAYLFELGLITKEQIGTILKMRDRMTSSKSLTPLQKPTPNETNQTPILHPTTAASAGAPPPTAVAHGTSTDSLSGINRVSVGTVIFLSILTLGIYGMYFFYTCAISYKRALPNRSSYFVPVFWVYVMTNILFIAVAIAQAVLGDGSLNGARMVIVGVGTVLGIVLLMEVLRMRQEMLQKYSVTNKVQANATHLSLYIVGSLLSVILVGVIFLIIQAVLFIGDHNNIAEGSNGKQ